MSNIAEDFGFRGLEAFRRYAAGSGAVYLIVSQTLIEEENGSRRRTFDHPLCGVVWGAALYVTAVEHPARMQCGSAVAVAEFGPSYQRAAVMQGSLAAIGMVCGVWVWLVGGGSLARVGCRVG